MRQRRSGSIAAKLNKCIWPVAAAAMVMSQSHLLRANPATWDGDAPVGTVGDDVTWASAANWTTNGTVDVSPSAIAPGDDLTFSNPLATPGAINLNANQRANSLNFTTSGWTFDAPASTDTLTIATGSITVGSGDTETINAKIGGNGGLKLFGSGTLIINGANTYTGAATVSNGTLDITSNSAINVGYPLTVNTAGTLLVDIPTITFGSGVTNSGNFTVNNGNLFTFNTFSVFTQSAGTITVNGTLDTGSTGFTYNGGSIIGTVHIGSTFFAPTLSFGAGAGNSGTFAIGGQGVTLSGVNPIVIQSNHVLTLTPTGGGGAITTSGSVNNAGNVTLIGATANTATLAMGMATFTNTGTLTTSATGSPSTAVDFINTVLNNTTGTVNINASTTNTGNITNSSAFNIAAAQTLKLAAKTFTQSGGQVSVAAGGILDISIDTLTINNGAINLASDPATPAVLKLGSTKFTGTTTTGTIASTGTGALAGSVDLVGATATMTIGSGTQPAQVIISASVTDGGLVKSGTGTLELSGLNSYGLGTSVTAGLLEILPTSSMSPTMSALPSGALTISGTGKVQLATNVTLGSQSSPTPASNVNISSLSITGSGQFDVNNNHIIINYGAGADPIASITSLIVSGYNGGAWNGLGGIISSAAAANSGSYGLGYADSADPGNPAGLASGQIEVMYTLLGDANLDGKVNGTDFAILAINFNQAVAGWDQADFNYDLKANGTDFAFLAANFNQAANGAAETSALEAFAAANGLMADVPEPGCTAVALIGAVGYLGRRSRAQKHG